MADDDRDLHALFTAHIAAVTGGDVDAVIDGYTPDAVLIHPEGLVQGRDALRAFYVETIAAAAGLEPEWKVQTARDIIFAAWTLEGASGCETLVVRDGRITAHTGFSTR